MSASSAASDAAPGAADAGAGASAAAGEAGGSGGGGGGGGGGGAPVRLAVEFGGGLEVLFGGSKRLDILLPPDVRSAGELVRWLAGPSRLLAAAERRDLFAVPAPAGAGPSAGQLRVRPGVLVLINDTDWALEGGADAALRAGDTVAFISTLHGG